MKVLRNLNRDPEMHPDLKKLIDLATDPLPKINLSPGFQAFHNRKPVAGIDYDADGSMCQDDFNYLTGRPPYSNEPLINLGRIPGAQIGDRISIDAAAPGTGSTLYIIKYIDDEGVYGWVISSTVGELDPWDVA